MDTLSIEKFLELKNRKSEIVNIHFKDRGTVTGIFVALADYKELKQKNFWRIINVKNMTAWDETNNMELSRLYNGASFTRLTVASK